MTAARLIRLVPAILTVIASAAMTPNNHFAGRPPEPPIRLAINIPAGRLDVFEHGRRTHTYLISVGRRGFETPAGSYAISRVEWNPWFHPPKSEWARNWKIAPPGPDNPMGRVKLQFSNLLYIHGTSEEEEERLGARASHGCVRMGASDIYELARLIQRYATPNVKPETLDKLQASGENRAFALRRPVPLVVTYNIVEVRGGHIIIHPDVYRRKGDSIRAQLLAVLHMLGVRDSQIDIERLDELSRTRRATRLTINLDTLIANGGSQR